MPAESSIEVAFLRSVNAFIQQNQIPIIPRKCKFKKYWLEVTLEDLSKICGHRYKVPKVPIGRENQSPGRRAKSQESALPSNPQFSPEEIESIRVKEGRLSVEMEEQKRNYLDQSSGKSDTREVEVIEALYGAGESWVDATEGVRHQLATHGGVIIAETPSLHVADPVYGQKKELRIRYRKGGEELHVTVPEHGSVNLGE
jgi:hypothetical protein